MTFYKVGPKEVNDLHKHADRDVSALAMHHTLGPNPTQAAPGNHKHDGSTSSKLDDWRIGDIKLTTEYHGIQFVDTPSLWLLCNGIMYSTSGIPDLFAIIQYKFGGSGVNCAVPNIGGPIANTYYYIKAK